MWAELLECRSNRRVQDPRNGHVNTTITSKRTRSWNNRPTQLSSQVWRLISLKIACYASNSHHHLKWLKIFKNLLSAYRCWSEIKSHFLWMKSSRCTRAMKNSLKKENTNIHWCSSRVNIQFHFRNHNCEHIQIHRSLVKSYGKMYQTSFLKAKDQSQVTRRKRDQLGTTCTIV